MIVECFGHFVCVISEATGDTKFMGKIIMRPKDQTKKS